LLSLEDCDRYSVVSMATDKFCCKEGREREFGGRDSDAVVVGFTSFVVASSFSDHFGGFGFRRDEPWTDRKKNET
jgi:hypothetical protein